MRFVQYFFSSLIASASIASAIPTPGLVELTVRTDDDYGTEYKRSVGPVETFACKRDNQSLSCLRRKDAAADESPTANTMRDGIETFVCKRDPNQSLSCLRRRNAAADESLTANTKREPGAVEGFVCERENQSLSCLRKKEAVADESLTANTKRDSPISELPVIGEPIFVAENTLSGQ